MTKIEEAFEDALDKMSDPNKIDNVTEALYDLLVAFVTSHPRSRILRHEPLILRCKFVHDNSINLSIRALYARDILKGKWPALEAQLLKEGDAYELAEYAIEVLRRPWPEAEGIIRQHEYPFEAYVMAFQQANVSRG